MIIEYLNMATIKFILDKVQDNINCSTNDYIEDICKQFSMKRNLNHKELIYLYKGKKLAFKNTFNEQIKGEDFKQNRMTDFCFQTKKKELNLNENEEKQNIHLNQKIFYVLNVENHVK